MKLKKIFFVSFVTGLLALSSCGGGGHTHTFEEVAEVPATCTATGIAKHYTCSGCDKYFNEQKEEVSYESLIIDKLPHDMHFHDAVAPTCTESGNIAYYSCGMCYKFFTDEDGTTEIKESQTRLAPMGHDLDLVIGQESTCIEQGWMNYYCCYECEELFEDDSGLIPIPDLEAWKAGDGQLPLADHTYGNPTYEWNNDYSECVASHTCTVEGCGHTESETSSGSQISYVKDTNSTCKTNEKGHNHAEFSLECFVAQDSPKDSVEKPDSKTGHHVQLTTGKGSTCIEHGWKDYYTCKDCGALFEDEAMSKPIANFDAWKAGDGQLPLAEHTYGDPTYEWNKDNNACVASHTCTVVGCGLIETETADGSKISYIKDTDATCQSNEKGHSHAEFTNTSFVAQDSPKDSVEKPDSKTGHHVQLTTGKASTCIEHGWKDYYTCKDCGALFEDEAMSKPIANFDAWKAGDGQLPLAEHTYGDPTYDWNDDYSACVASKACTTPGCTEKITETASGDKVTFIEDTPATCTEDAKGHSHAEFTNTSFVAQDSPKDSVEKPGSKTGHHVQLTTGKASTCIEHGWKDYYTCKDCGALFEDEAMSKPIADFDAWKAGGGQLPLAEHTYGDPTYEWNDDYSACVASKACTTPGCTEKITETASGDKVTFIEDTPATCTEDAKGHNHAEFTNTSFVAQDSPTNSVTKEDSALGHDPLLINGQPATSEAEGWKDYYQCQTCDEYFEDINCEVPISNVNTWKTGRGLIYKTNDVIVPTTSSDNWEVVANSPARVDFGSGIGAHTGECAEFRNYQHASWKESQLGITATFTNSDKASVNNISFTYYLWRDTGGTEIKADLTITISIIDNLGNKVEIDSFVIDKAESSEWINYSKNFKLINFDKLVIETKSEFVTLPKEKGINNQFYVCNLKLKSYPFGDVNISTTDESVWTYEATHSENNKIAVGSKPTWNETGGEYLALRAYQWTDWEPTEAGLTAKYTNATPKLVNKLEFKYFINSGSFIAPEATIKIYVLSNGVKTLIDTITLNKDTVTMDSDLDYSTTFDDLLLSELHIKLTTNAPEGTKGDTVVFFKGIAASYVS